MFANVSSVLQGFQHRPGGFTRRGVKEGAVNVEWLFGVHLRHAAYTVSS